MCHIVQFYPGQKCVSINGEHYTENELEKKIKTQTEVSILNTLKEYIKEEEVKNLSQIEIEFDDISILVASDMFKGDNHSQALIN